MGSWWEGGGRRGEDSCWEARSPCRAVLLTLAKSGLSEEEICGFLKQEFLLGTRN